MPAVKKNRACVMFRVGPVRARKSHPYMKGEWGITRDRSLKEQHSIKTTAIKRARTLARRVHANGGRSRLVVHALDGTVQNEYTYGDDS